MNSYLIDTISIRVIEVANPGCVGFSDPLGCIYHTVPVLLDPPSGWPDPAQPHTPRGDPAPALMLFNPQTPRWCWTWGRRARPLPGPQLHCADMELSAARPSLLPTGF